MILVEKVSITRLLRLPFAYNQVDICLINSIERHMLHLMVAETWLPDTFVLELTFFLPLKKSSNERYFLRQSKLRRSTFVWRKIPLQRNRLKWGWQAFSTHSSKLRRSTFVKKIFLRKFHCYATPSEWDEIWLSSCMRSPLIM